MPWIPILYPELDEHLIDTTTILAPTFPNIEQAQNALTAEWSESDQDELDLTGYLVEVDTQGNVKRHIRGDRMPTPEPLTKTDRHRMHIRVSYLDKLLFGSEGLLTGKQDRKLVDEIDRTQEILDYIGTYRGVPEALILSGKLEAQKANPSRPTIVRLLEASFYVIDDAVKAGKKKAKSKRTKNAPDMATAKAIAKNAIKIAKGKATEAEIVEAVIRATSIDATEARKIVKEIFPPKPKPKLTTAEEIERKKAKAEREIKKLEPYLDQMSEPSQKTVKSLIRKNVREELPCIPGPQPTEEEKEEADKPKKKAKPAKSLIPITKVIVHDVDWPEAPSVLYQMFPIEFSSIAAFDQWYKNAAKAMKVKAGSASVEVVWGAKSIRFNIEMGDRYKKAYSSLRNYLLEWMSEAEKHTRRTEKELGGQKLSSFRRRHSIDARHITEKDKEKIKAFDLKALKEIKTDVDKQPPKAKTAKERFREKAKAKIKRTKNPSGYYHRNVYHYHYTNKGKTIAVVGLIRNEITLLFRAETIKEAKKKRDLFVREYGGYVALTPYVKIFQVKPGETKTGYNHGNVWVESKQ